MSQRPPTLEELYRDYHMAKNHEDTIVDMMYKELVEKNKQLVEARARIVELEQKKKKK